MSFRNIAAGLVAVAFMSATVSLSAQAQGQAQGTTQAKPEQKPDPKAEPKAEEKATTPAGKWTMSIETPGGSRQVALDLKIDVKKVTGTLNSEMGETPLTGEYAEGKLTFSISIDAGGQMLTIAFTGTSQKDGSLAGTASLEGQEMQWTATRVKG